MATKNEESIINNKMGNIAYAEGLSQATCKKSNHWIVREWHDVKVRMVVLKTVYFQNKSSKSAQEVQSSLGDRWNYIE